MSCQAGARAQCTCSQSGVHAACAAYTRLACMLDLGSVPIRATNQPYMLDSGTTKSIWPRPVPHAVCSAHPILAPCAACCTWGWSWHIIQAACTAGPVCPGSSRWGWSMGPIQPTEQPDAPHLAHQSRWVWHPKLGRRLIHDLKRISIKLVFEWKWTWNQRSHSKHGSRSECGAKKSSWFWIG